MAQTTTFPSTARPAVARRVLHIFGAMDRGGAEMRTIDLMRRVDPAAFRLDFCTLSGRVGSLAGEIRALGGEVYPCAIGFGFPGRFLSLLRRGRYDVVHSHVQLASGMLLALAAMAGVKTRIAHFRSTRDERGDSAPRRLYRHGMHTLIDTCATDIIGCGRGAMEFAWGTNWRDDPRCRVIVNGLDVAAYALADDESAASTLISTIRAEIGVPGTPATAPILISVGRFSYPKNQLRMLAIFAAYAAHHPGHLVFAGRDDTPDGEAVRTSARDLHLLHRVHFLGERSDIPRLLWAADVLLLTSEFEGLPGAVLEATAAGTPIVATALPGVGEIADVLPGIVRAQLSDDDAYWIQAIVRQLARPHDAAARAEARVRFQSTDFSLNVAVTRTIELWRQPHGARGR